jgi:cell division transport system permease protein
MSRAGDEHGPLVDLGRERPQLPARARNLSPIVPRASIAGRALVAVVAIMTFLASITTGTVLLVSASAAEWQSEVASEITIQVRPMAGRDIDRDVAAVAEAMRAQRGIVEIRPFTKEESAKLLEPWLGSGLSLDDLPVPRVIIARVQPGTVPDLAALRSRVLVDDRGYRVRRHRHSRIGDYCDHHFGIIRNPRRDGGESPDRGSPALRRRRRPLHCQSFSSAFSAAWAGRRGDRRRHRNAGLWVF